MRRFYRIAPLMVLIFVLAFYYYLDEYGKKTVKMELDETDSSIYLDIQQGKRIKGWEKDDIIYFFVPSYIEGERITFENDKIYSVDYDNKIEYNEIQKLIEYDEQGNVIDSKNICFKHSANLYTMYIDLLDISTITKEDFVQADLLIVNSEGDTEYSGEDNLIKGHGNSTWEEEKKPYYIKLLEKEPLCGMKPGKKWLLLANNFEGTKILNKMFYDFASEIGIDYCSESDWVDLYINGEYRGNYLLCEKIDIEENRINLVNLEEKNALVYGDECEQYEDEDIKGFLTDSNPDNITGGYIIEKDFPKYWVDEVCGFRTTAGSLFTIKSPDNASVEEVEYLRDIFENIENLLEKDNEEVLQYIDVESFAKRFLLEEFILNSDAYVTSCYFYKKQNDDKIYAGPVWDYDGTVGESNGIWMEYDERSVLYMKRERGENVAIEWDRGLYRMNKYRNYLENVYQEILPRMQNLIYSDIDEYVQKVRSSVEMDRIRWDYGNSQAGHYDSLDNNIRYVKFFLNHRINFINRWLGEDEFEFDFTDGSMHKVTCKGEEGLISWDVKDGEFLKDTDLPTYDSAQYDGWVYARDKQPVSEYLPVYEDVVLELKPSE